MSKLNKKGFIAGIMVDLYAYLAFVLIILIFFLIFYFTKAHELGEIQENILDTSADSVLASYLRTPVDDNGTTIADLFSMYYIAKEINHNSKASSKYEDILSKKTRELIMHTSWRDTQNQVYRSSWQVAVYPASGDKIAIEPIFEIGDLGGIYNARASTQIPVHGMPDRHLNVGLVRGGG